MKQLSARYAAALYALTQDEDVFVQSAGQLMGCAPLWQALLCPTIRPAEKAAVLKRLPWLEQQEVLLHFYQLLCDKQRVALLPEIISCYHVLALERRGSAICVMTCVHPPDPQQSQRLRAMLCKLHHKQDVQLEIHLDPALLGGFVLELQGVTYERSVRGQLERLGQRLQQQ